MLLVSFLLAATRIIDNVRNCQPRRELHRYDYPLEKRNSFGAYSAEWFVSQMNAVADLNANKLKLNADLLELETCVNGDTTDITADLILDPAHFYPKHALRIVTPGISWKMGLNGRREQVISVQGVYGYHPDYSEAWQLVDSLAANITETATSLTVADADGADENGITPRFQAGQLLRIGTEYLSVKSVDVTTNVLGINRAQNGTLAAAHLMDSAVYVYRPLASTVHACTRLATWMYRQKDANVFDKATILNTGIQIIPSALPVDVRELLPPKRVSI
jgi:hypothetical protein